MKLADPPTRSQPRPHPPPSASRVAWVDPDEKSTVTREEMKK